MRRLRSAVDTLFLTAAAFSAGYMVHELVNNEEGAKRTARRLLLRAKHAGRKVKDVIVSKVQSFKGEEYPADVDFDDETLDDFDVETEAVTEDGEPENVMEDDEA